jgi:hypothetical protein
LDKGFTNPRIIAKKRSFEKQMRKSISLLAFVVLGAAMMYGQASRTWVSGVGDDANPCSRTAPCKTWAGAISKTALGGEIDALDPGGFGAVTITKGITLDGGGGQVASVLVSGTNGIVVQAGANDVVILRNLRINGINSTNGGGGLNGIRFLSGKDLNVENCYIFGFTLNGLDIALNQATQASVHVLNSVFKNNAGVGIRATNAQTPAVQVGIDNTAVILDSIGVESAQHARVVINRSLIQNASTDGVRIDDASTTDAQATIDRSDISYNSNGVSTTTAGSFASVGGTKLAFNSGCGLNNAGGSVFTFTQGGSGTNRGHGNANNSCGVITPIAQF